MAQRRLGFREQQVLSLVLDAFAKHGRAPSYTAIARHLSMEREHAAHVVKRLERRGLVSRFGHGRERMITWIAGAMAKKTPAEAGVVEGGTPRSRRRIVCPSASRVNRLM